MNDVPRIEDRSAKAVLPIEHDGVPGVVLKDRPYIDDTPADRHGWEARSRWGSRPVREFGRDFGRGG